MYNKEKRCCFAGHSEVSDDGVIYSIMNIAEKLINEFEVREFWVGNYGDFDKCCAKAIRKLKERYCDITLSLVIPYLTKEINDYSNLYYEKYDEIILPDITDTIPKRYHIIKTNEYMINKSNFLICYVNKKWGGAYKTYTYAKNKVHIFNISDKSTKTKF